MPLQATSGAASYDGFGGGVAAVPNYIEDVFSTYLYTGNGSTQTITNGIDLSTYGGLTWIKARDLTHSHRLFDTSRGATKYLETNTTAAQGTGASTLTAFTTSGFSLGSTIQVNESGINFASWTFRKQPKFFDIVTYTGNGTAGRTVAHNLGSVPGSIIVKSTSSLTNWHVYHRSLAVNQNLLLDLTQAARTDNSFNSTAPTATVFSLGGGATNTNGETYVAYLFAHNAGGFGLTGTDNVISCGSFTADGSGNATVNLGYEPQYILSKCSSSAEGWIISDVMRGDSYSGTQGLFANTSGAEFNNFPILIPTATGFVSQNGQCIASATYIYIAIRRGPMKVPTSGTSVFIPVSATPSGATTVTTNFPVDLAINAQRDAGTSGNKVFWDRLRGSSTAAGQGIFSNLTNAEVSYSGNGIGLQSNTTIVDNYWNTLNGATTPVIYWNLRRAPSFFDEVCYTGTGVARTVTHNLGVAPEMYIIKRRDGTGTNWVIYSAYLSTPNDKNLYFTGAGESTNANVWSSPTSTTFGIGTGLQSAAALNANGSNYVAYLFATCPGVSKVGSYTGNGTTQTINCGFTGGARFVLIKSTNVSGDWWVFDTARGITSTSDAGLMLNTAGAEIVDEFGLDPASVGFAVKQTGGVLNNSGTNYIYLAIA